jgi:hypothetical protein
MSPSTAVLKQFCWDRWTRAEKALSRTKWKTPEYAAAYQRTEFWRAAYNAFEQRELDETHRERLDELATEVRDSFPVYHRETSWQVPEEKPEFLYADPRKREGGTKCLL